MALLRILTGSLEGQEFDLPPDETFIGRGSSCQVRIGDQGVSSKHAKLWSEGGAWYLMDLGSTNGTFVNEKDIDRETLSDGDEITFGMTKATFIGDVPKAKPAARVPTSMARGAAPAAAGAKPITGSARVGGATGSRPVSLSEQPTVAPVRASAPALRAEVRTQDEVDLQTLQAARRRSSRRRTASSRRR